jgi:Mg2+ transporter MgtE
VIYLSQILGKPVVDATGTEIGTINDIAIATGEVFPRVTSLAFRGPDRTPFMLSWRKYIDAFDGDSVRLNVAAPEIRFSYLQPDEVLLARDLLNKQIVDTQGMKVVRVNDLKLSESRNQLRLLGAEVGIRGILRGISPALERAAAASARVFGSDLAENIIAWNYMELLDRDLSQVKLSVTHKRLHELHPADVADIMEQLTATQRAKVFEHFDNVAAAEAISQLEDELQADVIDDLSERRASALLAEMDPDDAADIIGDLPYDKAERLLRLMGVKDAKAIRGLLGYKEKTAGGIMTPEVTTVTDDMTVEQVIEHLRSVAEEQESIYYVYVVEGDRHLTGVISLRDLLLARPETLVADIADRELFTVGPDEDQEDVAEDMSKYDLLALPVVDESGRILGIVTVDDALDVLEEEAEEDLALASGRLPSGVAAVRGWLDNSISWLAAWLVLGVIGGSTLHAFWRFPPVYLAATLFLPLVIQLADEVTSHTFAQLISAGEDDRPSLLRRLSVDMSAGLLLGAASGLVALGLLQTFGRPIGESLALSAAIGLTVLLLTVVGAAVLPLVRRTDGTWRVTGAVADAFMKALGIALYLGLAVLFEAGIGR